MIIACVDGTGAWKDSTYQSEMKHSFVNRVHARGNGQLTSKQYLRGPSLLGFETGTLAADTARFVARARASEKDKRVCLAGFSRGGAAVIGAAQNLRRLSIPVDFMILFDAVDRSLTVDARTIPSNVVAVHHLRRHPDAGSRESFSNCGLYYYRATVYTQSFFMCTHGGVGGTPWCKAPGWNGKLGDKIDEGGIDGKTRVTYQQDLNGSVAAWAWIEPIMKRHGIVT